jgi:hypothetical protein
MSGSGWPGKPISAEPARLDLLSRSRCLVDWADSVTITPP